MHINPNIEKPIFIQIAEQLEDSIFTKVFPEETKIPSTNELSSLLNIIFLLFNLSTILYNFIFKFINNKFWATLIYFILIIILSYIYHRIVKKINKYLK